MKYLIAFLLLATPSFAQDYWNWSPYGKYQLATCAVQCTDGSRGSGVQIKLGGYEVVLTAAHVVADAGNTQASCIFTDGTVVKGNYTTNREWSGGGNSTTDVAVIFADHPGIPGLDLAARGVSAGDTVEFLTRGTNSKSIRHFYGVARSATEFNAIVQNGDSGGGVVNANHEVVSVQSSGGTQVNTNGGRGVYNGAYGPSHATVVRFLQRVLQKFPSGRGGVAGSGGANCPGGVCLPPQGRGGIVDSPPPPPYNQPIVDSPTTPVTPQQPVVNDQIEELKALIKAIPAGPPGKDGLPGDQGIQGVPGSDATVLPFNIFIYDKYGKIIDQAEVDLMSTDPDKRDIHLRFVEAE